MKSENIFDGIDQCRDQYIEELLEDMANRGKTKVVHFPKLKAAAAVLICLLVLGAGVSVAAATSTAFRNWLKQAFGTVKVTEVTVQNDPLISLGDNLEVRGSKESFICERKNDDKTDEETVTMVYSIQNNQLNKLPIRTFHGIYQNADFSFQYAVIHNEICAFNYKGNIEMVYPCMNAGSVYASLDMVKKDTVKKACLATLNLETQEISWKSSDDKICNVTMSPNGKILLLNYRSHGYWSAFDTETKQEHKVKQIDGYAHTSEIKFLDDYHILTIGDTYKKGKIELTGTNQIDLRTAKTIHSYQAYGDINLEWMFQWKKKQCQAYNIVNKQSFAILEVTGKDVQVVSAIGDYVLLSEGSSMYLCDMGKQRSKKIDIPASISADGELYLYLASREQKLLVSNTKEMYLVDIDSI